MKAKVNLGHQAVIDFIGGVEPVTAFLFELNGAAFATGHGDACARSAGGYCGGFPNSSIATGGGGNYSRGAGAGSAATRRSRSPAWVCITSRAVRHRRRHRRRAVHEYTHAVQGKYGDSSRWPMEGGAVQMECLLVHKMPSPTGYAQCMKTAGGQAGSS